MLAQFWFNVVNVSSANQIKVQLQLKKKIEDDRNNFHAYENLESQMNKISI